MAKPGYDENYSLLLKMFPGRISISVKEAAQALGVAESTIRTAISRVRNPFPARRLTSGKIVISIPQLARWLCSEERS